MAMFDSQYVTHCLYPDRRLVCRFKWLLTVLELRCKQWWISYSLARYKLATWL